MVSNWKAYTSENHFEIYTQVSEKDNSNEAVV